MFYYKVIDGTNIVGVATTSELRRVHSKKGFLIACEENTAQVIEIGGTYYHDEWMRPFYSDIPYRDGKVAKILLEEYEELRKQLDISDEPIEIEPEPPEEEPVTPPDEEKEQEERIMTADEMRQRIIELEEQNNEKDEKIDMLEECILEMSEYVYA